MGKRRTAILALENRFGWPSGVRLEFGPWWWRWWLILRYGGRRHAVITGERCVIFPADTVPRWEE